MASGARVGSYAIESRLGAGSYSDVYLARNIVSDQVVALKVLRHRFEPGGETARRIRTEAQVLLQVRSPHVVRFCDVGLQRDRVWFALEYLQGTTLLNASNGQPLAVADAVRHSLGIARGLRALYGLEARVIHRDLKPGNVMATFDGRTVLLDFGAAKMLGAPDKHRGSRIIGTVAYMAPERIAAAVRGPGGGRAGIPGSSRADSPEMREREEGWTEGILDGDDSTGTEQLALPSVDERSSIFSLGIILYELLAGHHPHLPKGTPFSPLTMANDILGGSPLPLSQVAPHVPDSLASTVARCLCKDPRDRFESAEPLIEALEGVERELEATSHSADSAKARPHHDSVPKASVPNVSVPRGSERKGPFPCSSSLHRSVPKASALKASVRKGKAPERGTHEGSAPKSSRPDRSVPHENRHHNSPTPAPLAAVPKGKDALRNWNRGAPITVEEFEPRSSVDTLPNGPRALRKTSEAPRPWPLRQPTVPRPTPRPARTQGAEAASGTTTGSASARTAPARIATRTAATRTAAASPEGSLSSDAMDRGWDALLAELDGSECRNAVERLHLRHQAEPSNQTEPLEKTPAVACPSAKLDERGTSAEPSFEGLDRRGPASAVRNRSSAEADTIPQSVPQPSSRPPSQASRGPRRVETPNDQAQEVYNLAPRGPRRVESPNGQAREAYDRTSRGPRGIALPSDQDDLVREGTWQRLVRVAGRSPALKAALGTVFGVVLGFVPAVWMLRWLAPSPVPQSVQSAAGSRGTRASAPQTPQSQQPTAWTSRGVGPAAQNPGASAPGNSRPVPAALPLSAAGTELARNGGDTRDTRDARVTNTAQDTLDAEEPRATPAPTRRSGKAARPKTEEETPTHEVKSESERPLRGAANALAEAPSPGAADDGSHSLGAPAPRRIRSIHDIPSEPIF